MSRQWVTLVIKAYQAEGFESAVAGKKRGMNEAAAQDRRLLTREEEEQKVAGWIIDKNPAQMKFDFALWTAKAVRKLIRQALKKDLSMSTVRRYLRSWGMTPQRSKKKAIQQNDAAIFWEDETAVQQDANWVRGYAPRGRTPTILHDRRACYGAPVMISAVNNQGLSAFAFQRSAVRRYSFIRFLHRLIKDYRKEARKLFFLPAYSPELNPDEFLNRQLKTELRQKGPKNHEETLFTKEITASFKEQLEPIRACLQNESTLYARAADICHVFIKGFPIV